MNTVHIVFLPAAYSQMKGLSEAGEHYLVERGLLDTTFFEFRTASLDVEPFSVASYAVPSGPEGIPSSDMLTGVPASWLPKISSDGFAEFVKDYAEKHPPDEGAPELLVDDG